MPERVQAQAAAAPEAAPPAPRHAVPATSMAAAVLALQRTAGNAAAGQVAAALAGAVARSRGIDRKVNVKDPKTNIPNPGGKGVVQTNGATIEGYLTDLCGDGRPAVDTATGAVTIAGSFCSTAPLPPDFVGPPAPSAATSSTKAGCTCLCDMIASPHTWTIVVDDGSWPHTDFDDHDAANGVKAGGTGGSVTAPSPNSPKLWGAGTASGKTTDIPSWLVLGHELCGHAWMGDKGIHGPDRASPRGEGGHQETVKRENLIRAEHGMEARGDFKSPNCGESYWRDKAAPGKVEWSGYRATCIAWRRDYNKKHGTSYSITDTIP
jgi:hypothetical protein